MVVYAETWRAREEWYWSATSAATISVVQVIEPPLEGDVACVHFAKAEH